MISGLILPSPADPAKKRVIATLVATPNELLERDLSAFPQDKLELLSRDHFSIAAVHDGQTLADTPASGAVTPEAYAARLAQAQAALEKAEADHPLPPASDDPLHDEMFARGQGQQIAETLLPELPDFRIALANHPLDLDKLAAHRDIEPESRETWKKTVLELNHLTAESDGTYTAPHRAVVLPYAYHHGQPIPEKTLEYDLTISADEIEQALGKNFPSERSVVVYEPYLQDPNDEVGHYRIALHETGHALDHALERLPGSGAQHRASVDALFAHDKAELAAGHDHFTSERARDDVREYFAEGVEAYFTQPVSDGHDDFRTANNRAELQRRNPELYAYLDRLMTTEIPASAVPAPPEPTPLPTGTPQPGIEQL